MHNETWDPPPLEHFACVQNSHFSKFNEVHCCKRYALQNIGTICSLYVMIMIELGIHNQQLSSLIGEKKLPIFLFKQGNK